VTLRFFMMMVIFPGLTACAALERRSQSSSEGYYSTPQQSKFEAEAREELGLPNGYLSSFDRHRLKERTYLKELEHRMDSRSDKAQYYQIKSSLNSDSERIQFLQLGSRDSKAKWVTSTGLNRQNQHSEEIARIIEAKDIALGMSESAVRESWGDPDLIEVAGDRVYGYKRWKYQRMVSGNAGYQREMRAVYFEGGRVVGWETQDL
jgi:hypothetical protein